MRRFHLFEWEDFQWFPAVIRDAGTDYLQFVANTFKIHRPILPVLKKGLSKSGQTQIIDLCSGGGGGWLSIADMLKSEQVDFKITFTDFYPNQKAFERTVAKIGADFAESVPTPVNVMDVPPNLQGLRTLFLCLHHFRPEDAKKILAAACASGQPIAIFEATDRTFLNLIPIILSPIFVLLFTPFIRPFSWSKLFFTYLLPIIPLFILWDGVVSVLRTYTRADMQSMTADLTDYEWEIGKNPDAPNGILYTLGYPK